MPILKMLPEDYQNSSVNLVKLQATKLIHRNLLHVGQDRSSGAWMSHSAPSAGLGAVLPVRTPPHHTSIPSMYGGKVIDF